MRMSANKTKKNTALYLIMGILIIFFLLFIFYYIYFNRNIHDEYIAGSLKGPVIFRNALIKSLAFLPVIIIVVYVISFSVLFTLRPFQTDTFSYANIAVPSYVVLIIFIIIILLSEFLIIPRLHKEKAAIIYHSKITNRVLLYAKELNNRQEYEKALAVLEISFAIDGSNKKIRKLRAEITDNLILMSPVISSTADEMKRSAEEVTLNYYERGRAEYEEGNYYNALFYLERALKLHKDNEELKELYRRCKLKAENSLGKITKEEEQKKSLIQQKALALEHLDNGEYYEAYEIFLSLNNKFPDLKDINLYLKTVKQELLKEDFLPEEIRDVEWLPSINNIIFFDREGYLNTIERAIPFQGNFYFINIKRYKTHKNKTKVVSLKYGKWIGNKIRLKNNKGFEKPTEKDEELLNIYPFISPAYLIYLGESGSLAKMLNIYEHFNLSKNLKKSGLDIENNPIFLSRKMGILFSVYFLTLFLSSLAWSRRSTYESPPKFKLLLFIIILPFMAYFLFRLYINMNSIIIYSHRYFTRFLFKSMNTAVYTGLINIIFSLIATFLFLSPGSKAE